MIFLDTNILIEILKENLKTIEKIQKLDDEFVISSITKMELFFGALDKKELKELDKFTSYFRIVDIDKEISKLATNLIFQYSKSHNLNIPDSIIASTAIKYNAPLFTYNLKDFKYIDNLELVE